MVASAMPLPGGLLPAAVAATVLPYAVSGGPDRNSTSCATPEKAGVAVLLLLPLGLVGPLLLLLPAMLGSACGAWSPLCRGKSTRGFRDG
jgi:hypothetical protein